MALADDTRSASRRTRFMMSSETSRYHRPPRQPAGSAAGPLAKQPGVTLGRRQPPAPHLAAMLQRLRQRLLSGIRDCLPIVMQPATAPRRYVTKQLLPERRRRSPTVAKLLLNRAQMAGIAGQLAEMQGKLTPVSRAAGRASTGVVPPEERRPSAMQHYRRHDKLAWRGGIYHVTEDTPRFGRPLTCWLTVIINAAMASQQLSAAKGINFTPSYYL